MLTVKKVVLFVLCFVRFVEILLLFTLVEVVKSVKRSTYLCNKLVSGVIKSSLIVSSRMTISLSGPKDQFFHKRFIEFVFSLFTSSLKVM